MRRAPWSLITIAVVVAGVLATTSALAFYSPLIYQYTMTPADTLVSKKTTLAAAAFDTTRIIRRVAGTPGAYGVDSMGVGDAISVYSTAACSTALFLNGSTTPVGVHIPAGGSFITSVRWIDSTITKDGGTGTTIYIELKGHKQWFSGGGTY